MLNFMPEKPEPIKDARGEIVLMGNEKEKMKTLFIEGAFLDPEDLPKDLQMWYVTKPNPEMDTIGIVGVNRPLPEDFVGVLITKKLPLPENGILFNFNPYMLRWAIASFEDDIRKGRTPDSKEARENIEKLKMIGQAYGYLDITDEELQVYERLDETYLSIEEFQKEL